MAMTTRSAGGARMLPARYYRSSDVYHRETEAIFARQWLAVVREEFLAGKGQFQVHTVEGEQIVLVRNEAGRVRAWFNHCRHRGTRLCEAGEGKLSKTIQCPYHGWTYDLDGKLVGAPNMPAGFARQDYGLYPAAVAAWEGTLFVCLDASALSLEERLQPIWNKFDGWELADLRVAHSTQYEVEANWKLIFQNYSECYHCPKLHPQLNRLTPYRDSSNDLEEGAILGGPMRLSRPDGSMTSNGNKCAPPLLTENSEPGLVYYYTIFPNLFLSLFPEYVLIHRLHRLTPTATRIDCDWLFHPEAMAQAGFDPSPAVEFWDLTNRQDWQICESAQSGVSSRAFQPGPYSDLESMLAAFDREYLRVLEAPLQR